MNMSAAPFQKKMFITRGVKFSTISSKPSQMNPTKMLE